MANVDHGPRPREKWSSATHFHHAGRSGNGREIYLGGQNFRSAMKAEAQSPWRPPLFSQRSGTVRRCRQSCGAGVCLRNRLVKNRSPMQVANLAIASLLAG